MQAFLGVTNNNKWKLLNPGDSSYWCVYRRYVASKGDLLFLYKTVLGIVQLYQLSDNLNVSEELQCEMRGMLTIPTKLVATFDNPLAVSDMKSNSILKLSGPVGRNFQQTIFELRETEYKEIIRLLFQKNPGKQVELGNTLHS